jgi:hypothetical protein
MAEPSSLSDVACLSARILEYLADLHTILSTEVLCYMLSTERYDSTCPVHVAAFECSAPLI